MRARGSQSTCAPTRRANWLREELQANGTDEVGVWRIEQQLLRVVTSLRHLFTSAGRWRWGRAGHRWSDRPVPARLIGVDVPEVGVSGGSVLRFGPFGRQDAHGRPLPVELVPLRLLAVCGIRQPLLWARVIGEAKRNTERLEVSRDLAGSHLGDSFRKPPTGRLSGSPPRQATPGSSTLLTESGRGRRGRSVLRDERTPPSTLAHHRAFKGVPGRVRVRVRVRARVRVRVRGS